MKSLYLIRGIPGSGKTSFAKEISDHNVAADDYEGLYGPDGFDRSKLKEAHEYCRGVVERWMSENIEKIAVHNTFTMQWEMNTYFSLASNYGYRVYTLIMENRHSGKSEHEVPETTISYMRDRFEISL